MLYTLPSVAVFFLLLPITGRGNTTAIIALVSYTLLILFRNIMAGLRRTCPTRRATPARGMGLTDAPAAVARRAAARAAGDHGRPADRDHDDGRARARWRSSPAPAASARRSSTTSPSSRTWSSRAASRVAARGRARPARARRPDGVTPWTRAATHDHDAGVPRRVRRRDRVHLPRARVPGRRRARRRLGELCRCCGRTSSSPARRWRSRSPIALPLGLVLGHTGRGAFAAISISNVGRAVPRSR